MANHEAKTKEKQQRSKTRKGPEPKQNTHTKTTRFAFDTGGSHRVVKNMHLETLLLLSAAQQTV